MANSGSYKAARQDIIALSKLGRTVAFVTWDNPMPANSSSMLSGLKAIGLVIKMNTKTSIAIALKPDRDWSDLRRVIVNNLNSKTGRAVYVNLSSTRIWEFDYSSKGVWLRRA